MYPYAQVWFDDYPWGDHWILCDQLAMTACLHPESVVKLVFHIYSQLAMTACLYPQSVIKLVFYVYGQLTMTTCYNYQSAGMLSSHVCVWQSQYAFTLNQLFG